MLVGFVFFPEGNFTYGQVFFPLVAYEVLKAKHHCALPKMSVKLYYPSLISPIPMNLFS